MGFLYNLVRHQLYAFARRFLFDGQGPVARWFNRPHVFRIPFGLLSGKKFYHIPRNGLFAIFGLYEPGTQKLLKKLVRENAVCLDVGSHVGFFSLAMSRLTGPKGRVVAIDALRPNTQLLDQSIRHNGIRNIKTLHAGVDKKPGRLPGSEADSVSMMNFLEKKSGPTPNKNFYPMTSLDALFRKKFFPRADFVKLDIEGFELRALQGSVALIKKCRPVLLVEVHASKGFGGKKLGVGVYEWLGKAGYLIYTEDDFLSKKNPVALSLQRVKNWEDVYRLVCLPASLSA